jgi:hypothetical protein
LKEFRYKSWKALFRASGITIVNQDVFPCNITEVMQSLTEGILKEIRSRGIGPDSVRQISDPRDCPSLLCISMKAKHKE